MTKPQAQTDVPATSLTGALLRIYWMIGGEIALIAFLFLIVRDDHAMGSPVSVGFWLVLAGMIVARYFDVTRFDGTKTDAVTRATLADVKRFALAGVVIGASLWSGVHLLS